MSFFKAIQWRILIAPLNNLVANFRVLMTNFIPLKIKFFILLIIR